MKYSIYNSFIHINAQHSLLYNAMSDKFLILTSDLADKYRTSGIKEIPTDTNDLFYQRLIQEKFLVETEKNESDLLKEITWRTDNDDSIYILTINPTLDCNFKCWYCYENHIPQSVMNEDMLSALRKHIKDMLEQKEIRIFVLSFFGGEPLLAFEENVKPLIDYTQNLCMEKGIQLRISFTTNGYLLTRERIEQLENYPISSFQITLDGDRKTHDKVRKTREGNGSYNIIQAHVRLLLERHIQVTLRINYTAHNIKACAAIAEDLSTINDNEKPYLHIDLQHVWQDSENNIDKEVRALKKIFYNYGLRARVPLSDHVRVPCYADKRNECVINYNGDVFKCTARDFTPENRYGHLQADGTIIWEGDRHERHMHTAFTSNTCATCRIAPLCKGGCAQTRMDYEGQTDYCLYNHDEQLKDKVILDRFEELFLNQ